MPNMRSVRATRAKGPLELVEVPIPQPGPGSVRIKVEACGICHSDSVTKEGMWPGVQFPRAPGHEVAGVVDAIAPASRAGSPASAWAWAGTAATAATAIPAGAETS